MIRLTNYGSAAMLSPSNSSSTGIGVPETNGVRPLKRFFYAQNFSVLHYVGAEWAAARLAGPFVRYANLLSPGSMIGVVLPGFKAFTNGVGQMTNQTPKGNSAQKPTNCTSLFSLAKRTPQGQRVICHDLTFDQALSLVSEIPAVVVKFARMQVQS